MAKLKPLETKYVKLPFNIRLIFRRDDEKWVYYGWYNAKKNNTK